MSQRKKVGEILIEGNILSARTVERVLSRAAKLNKKLGIVLEEMGLITEDELTNALAIQFGYKVVKNLSQFHYAPEMLKLMSAEVALQNMIFPLKCDGGWLALAMADPTNTRIIQNLSANIGLKIAPYLATRQDIYDAITRHYLGREPRTDTKRTIVVVEDEKLILSRLEDVLNRNGYRVIPAQDGLEAYKLIMLEKPQVVLTDKEMPKLNGYGLLAAMLNMPDLKLIPVILLTGRLSEEEEASAFEKGFYDYILKPVKDTALLTRVKRAFQHYESLYRPN
jgi:CheY-like chemotaxis protein